MRTVSACLGISFTFHTHELFFNVLGNGFPCPRIFVQP